MPGLLDYIIPNYQDGNFINPFDPTPTQDDYMSEYDIELTDPEKTLPFLPKPDPMGRQFDITNYMQDRQGLEAGGRGALEQAGQKSRQASAKQGFSGSGKSLLDTTRGDIVGEFGRQAQKSWTGLQQDIYERERRGGEDFLSAIGDLPEDSWSWSDSKKDIRFGVGETGKRGGTYDEWSKHTYSGGIPTSPGSFDGEQREGEDGSMYRWDWANGAWVPEAAGDIYALGAASGGG